MQNAKPRSRFLASLVDWSLLLSFSGLLSIRVVFLTIEEINNPTVLHATSLVISALLAGGIELIFMCLYFIVLPIYTGGQTIGKKLVRIKVVRVDGKNLNFSTLFIREIIGKILIDFMSLGISLLANGFVINASSEHLAFQDILAATRVVAA